MRRNQVTQLAWKMASKLKVEVVVCSSHIIEFNIN